MVELRCSVVSFGMVDGGRGAPLCRQPVGRRSHFDPCMPGRFGVGRLACGLFIAPSLLLQRFGWCMVVLAALWSACSSLGFFCCCLVDDVCAAGSFVRRPACAQPVMMSRCVKTDERMLEIVIFRSKRKVADKRNRSGLAKRVRQA